MSWEEWITEKRFTLFRTAIIQEPFIELILNEVPEGGRILETGFGQGTTMALLDDLQFEVHGFDYNQRVVEIFKERFPYLSNKVKTGNILDRMSYAGKFDAIIHQGVLEHFDDAQIIEILKLQATHADKVIFDVPNNQRENMVDEGDKTRFESVEFWENIVTGADLIFERYGRSYDWGDDLIPKQLKSFKSPLMKKIGRSSMFVCRRKP